MASKSVQAKSGDLKLIHEEKVKPSPGNVVVRITLRPVNPTDVLSYKLLADTFFAGFKDRLVIGSEGVGYIEEVGEGVTKLKVGQRVVPGFYKTFYLEGNGSWQTYVETPESNVFVLPESISDEVACQAIVNPWSAFGLLQTQAVPKGEYLVQSAAASQVGRIVIQLAKYYGIKTINIVRRDDVIEELKALGADVVINSSKEDVAKKVKGITNGKLAYGGIDALSGEGTKMVADSVRDGGTVHVYGVLSSTDTIISHKALTRGVQLSFWMLFMILPTPESVQEVAAEVFRMLDEKIITLQPASKRFTLDNFQDAIAHAGKQGRGGKALIES